MAWQARQVAVGYDAELNYGNRQCRQVEDGEKTLGLSEIDEARNSRQKVMKKLKTNVVAAELKRIAKANGGLLQPETVVEEARDESSPLHSRFQWDDTVGAQLYRIYQARQLIRVTVEVITGTDETCDVFVSLSPDRERESGGYRVMLDVLSDADMRNQMLSDAMDELSLFREKYHKLKELVSVFAAIKRVKRRK